MKKLFLILLVVLALSVTATVTSAAMPTRYYLASLDMACKLPDATGLPQEAVQSKVARLEAGDHFFKMTCLGMLPPGAELPKVPTKFQFGNTHTYCATWYGDEILLTTNYGAIVTPNRMSEITCTFPIF